MAELDAETLRELRRIKTAANLQQRAAQTTASSGMGAVSRGEYQPQPNEPISSPSTQTVVPTSISKMGAVGRGEYTPTVTTATKTTATTATTTPSTTASTTPTTKKIIGYRIYVDPQSGATYGIPKYDDGTDGFADRNSWVLDYGKQGSGGGSSGGGQNQTYTAPDGKIFTDLNEYNNYLAKLKQDEKTRQGQSAYDLLFEEFNRYGMGALVEPLKNLIIQGLTKSEFALRLRETDAYKKRFAANQARIQKGLRALSEAEYIGLEDQYQDVMRRYGLPETYYKRGDMGRQEGFEKFLAGDVSPIELEDRVQTAQRRVLNAPTQIKDALTQFYGNEISNGDILAYMLDPTNAIENIKRKVTAAEIGGAAAMSGLASEKARAEQLAGYGITGEAARQGYAQVAEVLPRGSQIAEFYKQSPYTQKTAEQEVFNLAGGTEAARERRKLTQLETAAFSGQAGAAGGALGRERAGAF